MLTGHCHCGAVRYEVTGDPAYNEMCHCEDCRRHSGAPVVSWIGVPADALVIQAGTTRAYSSSEHTQRHFCPHCGTKLFYYNEQVLPGLASIQTATLDDPNLIPPKAQIQVADRIGWMAKAHELPEFDRYPAPE